MVLAIVWGVNGFGNGPYLISLAPTLVLIFTLGWSLAILMGVLNVLFQDCQHLIEVLLQVLFYLTPIMYEPAEIIKHNPHLVWCMKNLNPLAVMLDLLRDPILYAKLPLAETCVLGVATAVLAAAAAALTLGKIEKRMVFYL